MTSPLIFLPSQCWRLVMRLWSIGTGGSCPRTTIVGVAALFLWGCATPLTMSTASTPEPPVERWRGLTVALLHEEPLWVGRRGPHFS